VPGASNEYLFFAAMEGHESDANLRRAVATLERTTQRLEILGSFPATEPVD
jgi:prephenate dehydratase